MTKMKEDLQKEIDNDVKAEKERAEGQEAAIRQEMATEAARVNKKIADDIAAADATLKAALQKEIDDDVKVEKERAEGKEAELLAAINKEVSDRASAVSKVQGEVDAVEKALADEKDTTKDGSLAKKIADEAARAAGEEADIRADFAAADTALHTTITAEISAAVKAEADRAKAEEADIRTDFAQADADLHATIKGEMAQVVASLNVKIVDNKLQIGLGEGVNFVTLNQFELEMVTDDEIDAIIKGLDA
jgi:hypothetical protein